MPGNRRSRPEGKGRQGSRIDSAGMLEKEWAERMVVAVYSFFRNRLLSFYASVTAFMEKIHDGCRPFYMIIIMDQFLEGAGTSSGEATLHRCPLISNENKLKIIHQFVFR